MSSISSIARSIASSVRSTLSLGNGSSSSKLTGLLKGASNTAEMPSMKKVPNTIHHFWHGDVSTLMAHSDNLNKTASLNSNYSVVLHVLPKEQSDIKSISNSLKGVVVKDVNSEKWFSQFKKSERYSQFNDAVTGPRPHLASGADIIKSEILQRKGGVWNDVDNKPLKPLPDKLSVPKGSVLTAGVVKFARWTDESGVHSSTLATHKNNAALAQINNDSLEKYQAVKGVIYNVNESTNNPDDHFKMISETAGSLHFSRELMGRDESFKQEVDGLVESGEKHNDSRVVFDKYFEPVASTGMAINDDDQMLALLQSISTPGHFVM